ncbi:TIGR02253 family HAD-type hydrolase [Candidatus Woesearchaeota archaeon]|nr:TIGR02253 family HAD-type hydrolase [Candidatus Woesearchaeota archaeon]
MIKALIFDLDNTLIDFWKMKHMCCEAAISSMIDAGLKTNKDKALKLLFELYDKYGLEDPKIFQKFLKKTTNKIDTKILAHGVVAYRKVKFGFLEPYPHVHHVLLRLKEKGVKLAIVTDAPKIKAWIRLASMKIGDYFDVVVAFEDTKQHKPSNLPFEAALRKLKVKPNECLMIGDWPERDIAGAKKLGMRTCFAKYGNPKVKRSGADYVITDVKELLDIVE